MSDASPSWAFKDQNRYYPVAYLENLDLSEHDLVTFFDATGAARFAMPTNLFNVTVDKEKFISQNAGWWFILLNFDRCLRQELSLN